MAAPKDGAQVHFSLPGSVQGFRASTGPGFNAPDLRNAEGNGQRALAMEYRALAVGQKCAAMTPTFSPPEMLRMRTYDLMATPLVYPGQTLRAQVKADGANQGAVKACLRLRVYDLQDDLVDIDGPAVSLAPGQDATLSWRLPDCGGQPIAEVGIALLSDGPVAHGIVYVDHLRWDDAPDMTLIRPLDGATSSLSRPGDGCDFWRMAWVNGVSLFSKRFPPDFRISQDVGEGIILHGTRQWTDYRVASDVTLHLGTYGGIAVRAQGLRRYYAARLLRSGMFQIVRVRDETTTVLAETPFAVAFETPISMSVEVEGDKITARANGTALTTRDGTFRDGALGLLVHEGALSTQAVRVGPVH